MADATVTKPSVGRLFDVILPLLLVTVLIALCTQLLVPFVGLLVWTIILAVCFYPLHLKLRKRVSNRMSAIIIGLGLSALVLVPTTIAAMVMAKPTFFSGISTTIVMNPKTPPECEMILAPP